MAQIFSKRANKIPQIILAITIVVVLFIAFVFYYWFSPKNLDVGYGPQQPVNYSHKLHVGQLGIDCKYCHASVEKSATAGVPPTQTCMNCHATIKKGETFKLSPVFESWRTDMPIPWVRIHKMPDYTYFDHSAHVSAGVGCVSCHGRVDQMEVVRQVEPLNMEWCLNCHRDPANHLRPVDKVTDMNWKPDAAWLKQARKIAHSLNPPIVSCSGCHR